MAAVYERYTQRDVIEFLVEVWGKFTICCMLCMEVVQSIGAPLDAGYRVKPSRIEAELHDQSQPRHPATATSPDMLQRADAIIRKDPGIQETCFYTMTMLALTQTQEAIAKFDWTVSFILPIVLIWHPWILMFVPVKGALHGKR